MSKFVPPFPPRLTTAPSKWQRTKYWRKNLLAGWEEQAFECEFQPGKTLLGCQVFLCNSPDSVRFAFANPNGNFERRSAYFRHALIPLTGDGLFVSDGELWRRRRRIVAPALHISHLPEFTAQMVETALETRARWTKLPPLAEVDMLAEMGHLTVHIICRTLFGTGIGRDDTAELARSFTVYQHHISPIDVMTLLNLPDWLPRWYPRPARRAARQVHAVVGRLIEGALLSPNKTNVFCRLLALRDQDGDEAQGRAALHNEITNMVLAGYESTAATLAWAWYLLSQAPEVETRLHSEIDQVLAGRPPVFADVDKLVYTRSIVEETMRLYPPVASTSREAVRDDSFNGTPVPKGSIILVVSWLLHRHKKLWRNPDHFMPERFLPGSDEPVSKFAYIPFGIGPRICTGMAFGLTETILCIATMAQQFQFRLKAGHRVDPQCRLTLRPGETLPMSLQRRNPPQALTRDSAPVAAVACPFGHGSLEQVHP